MTGGKGETKLRRGGFLAQSDASHTRKKEKQDQEDQPVKRELIVGRRENVDRGGSHLLPAGVTATRVTIVSLSDQRSNSSTRTNLLMSLSSAGTSYLGVIWP